MSKKQHNPGPIPPGNQTPAGPAYTSGKNDEAPTPGANGGAPFEEQDPQRRLGGYGTAGEHPIQQPGRLNDGGTHRQ